MKQILTMLLMVITITAYSQKKDLVTVNAVKPKMGQKMARMDHCCIGGVHSLGGRRLPAVALGTGSLDQLQ